MKQNLTPIDWVSMIFDKWWVLLLSMVIFGVGGFVFTLIHPPVYEASGWITTSVNFGVEGQIGDYAEDHLITAVGDIIHSSEVLDKVYADLKGASIIIGQDEFSKNLFLDRQGYRWVLRYRDADPELARKVVEFWLNRSEETLSQMKVRSEQGIMLSNYLSSLVNCISQSTALEPASASCKIENLGAIQAEINSMTKDPTIAESMNKIGLYLIDFQVTQKSTVKSNPALHDWGTSILAGAMVGLFVGLICLDLLSKKTEPLQESQQ